MRTTKKNLNKKHVINFENKKINSIARPALFFDRDGVLLEDTNYLSNPQKVAILPGAKNLLKYSRELGWLNIVITNQSGIGRGFYEWEEYELVTKKMLKELGDPHCIDGIYANGEKPSEINYSKSWRKPSPNMIFEAESIFKIDINQSIIIGDRLTDLLCGKRAGIKKFVHVLTGHGINERLSIIDNFNNKNNLFLIKNLTEFPINSLLF